MGCCASTEQQKEDERVGKKLSNERKINHNVKNLLLFGSDGPGKSTLFKQIRMLHGSGYDDKYRLQFKDHIFAWIVDQMRLAFECIEILREEEFEEEAQWRDLEEMNGINGVRISYNDLELTDAGKEAADKLEKLPTLQRTKEVAELIKTLWAERAIKYVFALRDSLKIDDMCEYFWEEVDRIVVDDYVPSDYDILAARYYTVGVIEQTFEIKRNLFHVFDVGGNKAERGKWLITFESVTAVIFCASLSCYNEVMLSDESKNSMVDQIEFFERIVNNKKWFDSTMILFLTKKDLFAEKIERIPITMCAALRQYAGLEDSYDDAMEYIKKVFESQNTNRNKQVFTHSVNCTDTNDVEKVFNDILTVIINASLAREGLIA